VVDGKAVYRYNIPKAPQCPAKATGSNQDAMVVTTDDSTPIKAPPGPIPPRTYYCGPVPPPVKAMPMAQCPTTPPKALTPRPPAYPPGLDLMDSLLDSRDLNRLNRAKAQVAKAGKAASSAVLTGLATSAATAVGADAQQMDPLNTNPAMDNHRVAFTFALGILVGMILLRFLDGSMATTLHRLSGYVRYFFRLTYYLCKTLSFCTCNCRCNFWFRQHGTSVDRIYDRMAAKGKSKGKGKLMTLTQRLASARDYARSTRS
jgi:hypothetical protein